MLSENQARAHKPPEATKGPKGTPNRSNVNVSTSSDVGRKSSARPQAARGDEGSQRHAKPIERQRLNIARCWAKIKRAPTSRQRRRRVPKACQTDQTSRSQHRQMLGENQARPTSRQRRRRVPKACQTDQTSRSQRRQPLNQEILRRQDSNLQLPEPESGVLPIELLLSRGPSGSLDFRLGAYDSLNLASRKRPCLRIPRDF